MDCDQWPDRRDTQHDGVPNDRIEFPTLEDRLRERDCDLWLRCRVDRLASFDDRAGVVCRDNRPTEFVTLAIEHLDRCPGFEPERVGQMRGSLSGRRTRMPVCDAVGA